MKRIYQGLSRGIMIGLTMALIFSSIFGGNKFYPVSPVSFMGEIYYAHLNENLIMFIAVVLWGCIGLLFQFTSLIFTHTDWSITKTTVMHFMISYIGFLPLAILSGWFPLYISAILMFTFIFIIIYFIMWYINYSKAKKMVAAINNVLKSEHDK
jgi:hypothetical protein